jgi:hypothetical protein
MLRFKRRNLGNIHKLLLFPNKHFLFLQEEKIKLSVGDIPNRYTSDVVLNQQARVAHQGWYGGFTILGGPVAEANTAVLDAGANGGYLDRSMADH